jgi:integrase
LDDNFKHGNYLKMKTLTKLNGIMPKVPKRKGLYKRGDIWWIRYADAEGKMYYESTKSKSLKVAEALLIARKRDVQVGHQPIRIQKIGCEAFRELVVDYSIWAQKQKSYERSKKYLIAALSKEFGVIQLRQFNTRLIEGFISKVLAFGKKPATANRLLATLKHIFTKGMEWEVVDEATLKKVHQIKFLPENNQRLRYLSEEESLKLIEACAPHLRPIVVTALNTGMRREEILSLKWEQNLDLKNGFILLDKTKNSCRREIPINQTLMATLKRIPRHISSPYVFVDGKGKRFGDVRKSFFTAVKSAGITDFTFHDMRHTFASTLVMKGVDLTTVKELLGHSTLTMTLRYSHLSPAHKVKAVGVLDNFDEIKIALKKV